jgi:peptidoglycan hydrolase-like protein with peptidoglycan-binding domain
MRALLCLLILLALPASRLLADETIRQIQEELRKRNLYFGNIDGRESSELTGALKRYQTRKGFAVTGGVDQETANSLHVQAATLASTASLPDEPVLRSDTASAMPESQRLALQKEAELNPDLTPTPAPPAEPPAPGQDLSPERVTKLVQDYLRDGETDDIAAQVRYFAYPVDYFDHGKKEGDFVTRDVQNYVRRWPQRKYTLLGPVSFFAGDEGVTNIEFTIAFELESPTRKTKKNARGRTKNSWTIRPEGGELKIVAIKEQRLHE